MNGSAVRSETRVFTDGDVVLERTVEFVERGVVISLTVESTGSEPTGFELVEEFPPELPVADAGFQPGTEPAGGRVDAGGARIEDTVGPDEELTVVYALQLFEPAPAPDLGDPELAVEGDRPAVGETGSVRARGGSATCSARSVVTADDGPRVPTLPAAESPADSGDRRTATDGGGPTGVVDADGTLDGASDDGARAASADRADAVETADRVDEAVETAEWVRATTGTPGASTDDGWADGASADAATGHEGRGGADGGVVSELVAELRDGSVSDRERAALRRELGVGRADSDDVRIEHLESRMGEFAAYAEALRAVIDEHGTAEAFVGRFEDRIDGLRADLDAVESELSATREAVADVEDLRESVDERHGRNAEAIERLERRVEAVTSFREELVSVFDDLDGGTA